MLVGFDSGLNVCLFGGCLFSVCAFAGIGSLGFCGIGFSAGFNVLLVAVGVCVVNSVVHTLVTGVCYLWCGCILVCLFGLVSCGIDL